MPPKNFLEDLANLFGALSRIFGDPDVQESGQRFMDSLDRAGARELPEGVVIRGAIDVPNREKEGVD